MAKIDIWTLGDAYMKILEIDDGLSSRKIHPAAACPGVGFTSDLMEICAPLHNAVIQMGPISADEVRLVLKRLQAYKKKYKIAELEEPIEMIKRTLAEAEPGTLN